MSNTNRERVCKVCDEPIPAYSRVCPVCYYNSVAPHWDDLYKSNPCKIFDDIQELLAELNAIESINYPKSILRWFTLRTIDPNKEQIFEIQATIRCKTYVVTEICGDLDVVNQTLDMIGCAINEVIDNRETDIKRVRIASISIVAAILLILTALPYILR